jgi:hypothetical protein
MIECLHRPRYKLAWISHNFPTHKHVFLERSANPHWLMYHCHIHSNVSIYIVVLLWKCHKLSYATGTVMLLWKRLICHNIIMNGEIVRIWKVITVACFKVGLLIRHLSERPEEKRKNLIQYSRWSGRHSIRVVLNISVYVSRALPHDSLSYL